MGPENGLAPGARELSNAERQRLLNPPTWLDWSWLRPLLELSLPMAVATYERSRAPTRCR